MDRRGITGVVKDVNVAKRRAILVPLDGEPQLITHEIGSLQQGDGVIFDEVIRGARRKPLNTKTKKRTHSYNVSAYTQKQQQ